MDAQSQKRLDAFERMLASVQAQYGDTLGKMERLKAEGRKKSVSFRQLLGEKLRLQSFLSTYALYGLLSAEENNGNRKRRERE